MISDHTSVIVAGGVNRDYLNDVQVFGSKTDCQIKRLPFEGLYEHPSVFQLGRDFFVCGGTIVSEIVPEHEKRRTCLKLENGEWKKYNFLIRDRVFATSINTKSDEVYIFGGNGSPNDSEILRFNNAEWQKGPDIPDGFSDGCGVRISETELLLIGGSVANSSDLTF